MRRMVKGEGKAGCAFYALLAIIVGFLALKIVPHQVAKLQLKDYMNELALSSPDQENRWYEERIHGRCIELEIPADIKNIKVKKSQKRIVMDVSYTATVDMVVTKYPMKEKIHLDREVFLF